MSVINPNETERNWRASKREAGVHLYLSNVEHVSAELIGARTIAGPVELEVVPVTDWIDPDTLSGAAVAVVQVDADSGASIKRFQMLAEQVSTPLIAASYDPPLSLVRTLLRGGAKDVLALPLSVEELEAVLLPLSEEVAKRRDVVPVSKGKLVTIMKSVGGVGATSLLSQLALRFASDEVNSGREACLIDLDVQFGDVAFQLGLKPAHTLLDLLEAGPRLDGELLRATTTDHASGLKVVASPFEMMPIEGMPTDQLMRIVELARREFGTVFLDLPANWTNWSLSLVAQSDLVLLITELSVADVNRCKRQLELLRSQDLNNLDVRVVVNRFEKALARVISTADFGAAVGRNVQYTVANDYQLMRSAIERGVPIRELKRKSALGSDLDKLNAGVAAALGLER